MSIRSDRVEKRAQHTAGARNMLLLSPPSGFAWSLGGVPTANTVFGETDHHPSGAEGRDIQPWDITSARIITRTFYLPPGDVVSGKLLHYH